MGVGISPLQMMISKVGMIQTSECSRHGLQYFQSSHFNPTCMQHHKTRTNKNVNLVDIARNEAMPSSSSNAENLAIRQFARGRKWIGLVTPAIGNAFSFPKLSDTAPTTRDTFNERNDKGNMFSAIGDQEDQLRTIQDC